MHKQKGLSLSGFIVWALIVICGLLLGFKIGPSYFEYFDIVKQLKAVASDPDAQSGQRRAVEGAFVKRALIENIRAIGPDDLQIEKDGDRLVVSADYSVRVPLFGNLSACLDFHPSSDK